MLAELTVFLQVPISVSQVTEVGGDTSTVNVNVSWTVSPIPDSQTLQYYTYTVQYRLGVSSAWTTITGVNWTSMYMYVPSLMRNVAYVFTVTPVTQQNKQQYVGSTSDEYQFMSGKCYGKELD